MASRFATAFKDFYGNNYVIQLHDSEHIGTESKYTAGASGFMLNYEGEDVVYSNILSSQCTIEMYIEDSNRAAITQLFTDIAQSNDENRFTILVFLEGVLYWRGKLQSERTAIPDQHISLVTLQANDGFGRLKSIAYDDNGTFYTEWDTVIGHMTNILKKLDLFDYGGLSNQFAISTNWKYSEETWPLLDNMRFQHDAVKQIKSDGTILPVTCYDVLIQILNRFGLRVVQQGGIFYFQNIAYLGASGSKSYDVYDEDGAYVTTTSAAFNTAIVQKLSGGASYFREPAKCVTEGYAFKDSLAGSNLFNGLLQYNTPTDIGLIPAGNEEVFGVSLGYIQVHTGYPPSLITYWIEHIFKIQAGSLYLTNESGTMEWVSDTAARVRINGAMEIEDAYTFQISDRITFLSAELPDAAEVTITWTWRPVDADYNPITPGGSDVINLTKSICTIVYAAGEPNEGTLFTVACGENVSGEMIELPTFVIGDLPYLRSIGRLQYYDTTETDWINTGSKWGYGTNESLSVMELTVREILAIQRTAVKINTHVIKQSYPGCANRIGGDIVMRADFTANTGQWRIDSFTPVIDRADITFTNYIDSEQLGSLPNGFEQPSPSPSLELWKRTGTLLEPKTTGDKVSVNTGNSDIAITGQSLSIGIYGLSEDGIGVQAESPSGFGLFGTSQAGIAGVLQINPTSTNTIAEILRFIRTSSGTAANNIGQFISWYIENSAGASNSVAQLAALLTNATSGSETSAYTWWLRNAGASLAEVMRLTGAGQLQMKEARIGDATDNTTFAADGTMTMNGKATVWEDLRIAANDLTPGGSNDPSGAVWLGNLRTVAFSASQMNELFFECQIPHSYKEGTDIYPHIHWRPLASAATATRVRWGLEYVWQNMGADAPVSTTTIYTATIIPNENLVGYKHYVSAFAAITGTGKTISSMLSCRVFRDATNAADNFTGEAGLMEIDFHFESDTLGSQTETSKT